MTMNRTLPAAIALLLLALVLPGALAAGCGSQTATTSTTGATAATAATTTPGTGDMLPATTGRAISFTTQDGVTLKGHVFGSGQAGVILAHMYPADQTSWYPTAQRLAQAGYLVLTFDFRGYGESGGSKQIDLIGGDVSAAITQIRKEGAGSVVLAGASMGGTASLVAGDQAQSLSSIRLAGIATLSAPVEFQGLSAAAAVPRIIVPLLFIAAEKDAGAAGAQQLEQLSAGKGDLQIVPGSDHGTDLLTGQQAAKVYQLLLDFIKESQA
jgi:pimeloyl-ACP methyl ester carboxylesterase